MPLNLLHRLDRSICVPAHPEAVFAYFTDSARWASWFGAGSTIDPRPGGRVYVCHPGNVEASGEMIEMVASERVAFTYGYASGKPVGPGESRVTVQFAPDAIGTRLTLTHELADAAARDQHIQGWRYQLSVLANLVANDVHGNAADRADAWFSAWAEPDTDKRRAAFEAIASPDVRMGDRYSTLEGLDDVTLQAGAVQKFMPGMAMTRDGDACHCLGTAIVDWTVPGPDGAAKARGTNVFTFGPDGKIAAVTGFWR